MIIFEQNWPQVLSVVNWFLNTYQSETNFVHTCNKMETLYYHNLPLAVHWNWQFCQSFPAFCYYSMWNKITRDTKLVRKKLLFSLNLKLLLRKKGDVKVWRRRRRIDTGWPKLPQDDKSLTHQSLCLQHMSWTLEWFQLAAAACSCCRAELLDVDFLVSFFACCISNYIDTTFFLSKMEGADKLIIEIKMFSYLKYQYFDFLF